MQRLLKEISDQLQAFIRQRDDVTMILSSPAADALPVLKILEGLEEASTSDLYWAFTEKYSDSETYVNAIIKEFALKHELVRLAMEKEGMTPWPMIPPSVLSETELPPQRLRDLSVFSRSLLPVPNGGNNVWIFYPLEIADELGFVTLMEELIRHEFPFPWCHHLRFIIRDDSYESSVFSRSPRVLWYKPDLSIDAINRSLEMTIADETLPLNERMAQMPIMAGNDFALGRYPEALQKYELLLRYHAPLNNTSLAAFALNGMGEVYEKVGDLERANESYQAALIPASHGENPPIPIFLNVVLNLANLRFQQEIWSEAEEYFDLAQQLATVGRNAPSKINALDNLGVCRKKQGKNDEAVESWNNGAVIAAQLQDVQSCRTLLGRLQQHYSEISETTRASELQDQLAALGPG